MFFMEFFFSHKSLSPYMTDRSLMVLPTYFVREIEIRNRLKYIKIA